MKTKTILGLDIKSDAIRLVKLKKHKNEYTIDWLRQEILPQDVMQDERIINFPVVEERLAYLIKKTNCKQAAAAIALPSLLVNLQTLSMPHGMNHPALLSEIKQTVHKELNISSEQLAVDYTKITSLENIYDHIYVAVTHKSYLSQYLACIKNAGLRVKVVDIDMYAMLRTLFYELTDLQLDTAHCLFFYATPMSLQCIAFNADNICFVEQVDIQDLESELHYLLNAYHCVYPDKCVQQAIVCADETNGKQLQSLLTPIFPSVQYMPRLSRLSDQSNVCSLEWMTALGLAMRELPPW